MSVNEERIINNKSDCCRNRRRLIKILLIVFGVLLLVMGGLYLYFQRTIGYKAYYDDLIFISPDGEYRLTVCEWQYFAYSGSELYLERTENRGRGQEVGTTFSGSPNGVFSATGDYRLEWNESGVTVYYRSYTRNETDDPQTWRRVDCILYD